MKILRLILLLVLFSCNQKTNETADPKGNLAAMNRAKIVSFIDTTNNLTGKEYKVLIVGNSLTLHSIAPGIGWNKLSGMAASSMSKDFAHLLFVKIESKLKRKVKLRITNLSEWERNYEMQPKLDSALTTFEADVAIFQLGENVSLSDPDVFINKYTDLINQFKGSKIICLPFFPDSKKNLAIKQVAENTGAKLANLSKFTEPINLAKNDNPDPLWSNPGIGIHPGDVGMSNIASEIFTVLNPLLK